MSQGSTRRGCTDQRLHVDHNPDHVTQGYPSPPVDYRHHNEFATASAPGFLRHRSASDHDEEPGCSPMQSRAGRWKSSRQARGLQSPASADPDQNGQLQSRRSTSLCTVRRQPRTPPELSLGGSDRSDPASAEQTCASPQGQNRVFSLHHETARSSHRTMRQTQVSLGLAQTRSRGS